MVIQSLFLLQKTRVDYRFQSSLSKSCYCSLYSKDSVSSTNLRVLPSFESSSTEKPDHTNTPGPHFVSLLLVFVRLPVHSLATAFTAYTQNTSLDVSPVIWVNAFNRNTTKKNYLIRGGGSYTVGAYQLVVEMEKGVIKALTWIDGCGECHCDDASGSSITCPSNVCVTNNCAISTNECLVNGATTCDLKIFVAWVGTDINGRPCTSAGSLPYNFVQFGLSPAYRAAAGVDKQYLFDLNFGNSKAGASTLSVIPSFLLLSIVYTIFVLFG